MKKTTSLIFVLIILSSFVSGLTLSDVQMNSVESNFADVEGEFSFLAAGHIYGRTFQPQSTVPYSIYPAEGLLANIDMINDDESIFFMLLGDSVHKANKKQFDVLSEYFLEKIDKPIFNAVGNHEMQNRELYVEEFGETNYYFSIDTSTFIVLDTATDLGVLSENNKNKFLKVLNHADENEEVNNIFIFSHNLIWQDSGSYNQKKMFYFFQKEILPELEKIDENKRIIWISGDANYPLFYKQGSKDNIKFYSVSLNDVETDALLKVNVKENDWPVVEPISLTGIQVKKIEEYAEEYWENWKESYVSEGVRNTDWDSRNLFYRILDVSFDILKNPIFYLGLFGGIILGALSVILYRLRT